MFGVVCQVVLPDLWYLKMAELQHSIQHEVKHTAKGATIVANVSH